MIRLAVAASLLAACSFGGNGAGEGDGVDAGEDVPRFPTGHKFRKAVNISPSGEIELFGFMAAVFTAADAEIAQAALADGSDLMLTTGDDDAPLAIEVESFDPETGQFALWVQRDPLTTETLYLYYGLETAAPRPTLEWPFNFRGVWHGRVDDDLALDSSRNNLDALRTDDGVLPEATDGAVGVGIDMASTSARFATDGDVLRFASESFTYSAWVNVNAVGGDLDQPWHFGGAEKPQRGYDMELGHGPWQASLSDGAQLSISDFGANAEFTGQWTYLVAVVDRDLDLLLTYANGKLVSDALVADTANLAPGANLVARIGGDQSHFIGVLDEVRVNSSALGAARIAEQYANVTLSSFLDFGVQERPDE